MKPDLTWSPACAVKGARAGPRAEFEEPRTLIDDLLAEQGRLSAVEKFSHAHDRHEIPESRYCDLIPLSAPPPGTQFAFEVDLDQCSGCKACVTACHSLNGLDDGEAWREVGTLMSDDWRHPSRQIVTTACHHCVDPACLNGCPVLAYEKDTMTGIVRHLDDQCIGCQYCVMMCPYDVPKYSEQRGIVRKCDLCSQRLAVGEAPACVQACPNEAIRITVVEQEAVRAEFRGNGRLGGPQPATVAAESNGNGALRTAPPINPFLPASPDPALTLPTTRYVSKQRLSADLIPADATETRLQPPHWPLVWMLVLTQLGVGAFTLLPLVPKPAQSSLALLALGATLLGLAGSVLHLGRPSKAWRSFLGLRRSWLSREIVVFTLVAPPAALATAGVSIPSLIPTTLTAPLLWATGTAGLLGVLCSAMVYHDTHRALWRGARSVARFFGTTAVLGLASAWLITTMKRVEMPWLPVVLALAVTLKLAGEHRLFRRAAEEVAEEVWPKNGDFDSWSLSRSAVLMRDNLGLLTRSRFFFAIAGGIALPLASSLPANASVWLAALSFALCLLAEFAERSLFFRAVVPPKMPGDG